MNRRSFLFSGITFGAVAAFSRRPLVGAAPGTNASAPPATSSAPPLKKVIKSDAEWKRLLTAEQYRVTRQKGTEAPYSSPLNEIHQKGVFACVCCGLPLFSSKAKFESHTGWPSFWAPIDRSHVREEVDRSMTEERTEVLCARCDAHLGHVFDDGPKPTGLRYCMNGVALNFVEKR